MRVKFFFKPACDTLRRMPVTFNLNFSRILARRERAQANVDRKKVARRLEKERLGIKEPEFVGTWSSDGSAPGGWAIQVDRWMPGHVGDVVDVGVVSKSGRRANIRGAKIVSFYSGKWRWGTLLHPPAKKGKR